jgi:phytoene dehydrogenase-like protein
MRPGRRCGDASTRRSSRAGRRRSACSRSGEARMSYDWLVVGAGFAGSVLAERLASRGDRVLVVDRRPHVGGNAYDRLDEAGILIHQYGPHIFHTNSEKVVAYLSRFTAWRDYEHRVLARGRAAPADPDQPRHGEPALRARPRRRGDGAVPRGAARAGRRRCAPRRTSWSRPWGATSTRSSSAATRASNGASIRRSCRSPSPRASRADEPGRPLLHRQLPEDAGRGLHADVRADARPSR